MEKLSPVSAKAARAAAEPRRGEAPGHSQQPSSGPGATLARLQREVGNAGLQRLWPADGDDPPMMSPRPEHDVRLGAIDDPLEREAEAVAQGGTPAAAGGAHPATLAEASPSATEQLRALRGGGGDALAPGDLAYFGARFGQDLSQVRVHTGALADGVTETLHAQALTVGEDIVLGSGAGGHHTLAHELAHVIQQRRSSAGPWIQREPQPGPMRLKAGDEITVAVYLRASDTAAQPRYSRRYRIGADGTIVVGNGPEVIPIALAGLPPQDAAQRIADRLVEAEIFRGPRVCVTGPGMTAPACADAKVVSRPLTASTAAPEAASPRPPERPRDPEAEQTQRWNQFIALRQASQAKLPAPERDADTKTMEQFLNWYQKHHADPDFATADPAAVWADISVGLFKHDVEAASRKRLETAQESAARSPEVLRAKGVKFDEFLALSRKLWGYSARTFPYSIPLDSQGKDILVTGDPALQTVLDALARDLTHWAGVHMSDPDFTAVSPEQVVVELLDSGYAQLIVLAQTQPLAHETIDRNEILARSVLSAFGESVATALLVVAFVGLFVGANVITAGAATVLFAGLAGYGGVTSYLSRREEIERSGYSVPVPETILDSAADAVGVGQLVEGITGHRLGTGAPLGSEARSGQLGAGAGNIAMIVVGSRAFRAGQRVGQRALLGRRAVKPGEPNVDSGGANVNLPALDPAPTVRTVAPGVVEVYQLSRAGFIRITEHGWEVYARLGDSRPVLAERWVEREYPAPSPEVLQQAPHLANVRATAIVSLGGRRFGVGVTAEGWFVTSPGASRPLLSGRFAPRLPTTPLLRGQVRATDFVPNLTTSPDFTGTLVRGWQILEPRIPSELEDVVQLRITAIAPDGSRGSVIRSWNRKTNVFTHVEAELGRLPSIIATTPELIPGRGTPIEAYLTLRLMAVFKRLGADFSGRREVHIENVTNVPSIAKLASARLTNMTPEAGLRWTDTVQYVENSIVQSGGRIASARVEGGEWIRWSEFSRGSDLTGLPPLPPDLLVRWKYNVILSVEPVVTPPAPGSTSP